MKFGLTNAVHRAAHLDNQTSTGLENLLDALQHAPRITFAPMKGGITERRIELERWIVIAERRHRDVKILDVRHEGMLNPRLFRFRDLPGSVSVKR